MELAPIGEPRSEDSSPSASRHPAHTGTIVRDGRGHRKHFWTCCGCKVNTDSPHEAELAELQRSFDALDLGGSNVRPDRGSQHGTGSGRVDRQGMARLCEAMGKRNFESKIDEALSHLQEHMDDDGSVDFADFKDHWSCHFMKLFTGEGRLVEGTVVERALGAKDKIQRLEGLVHEIKARPQYRSAELDDAKAAVVAGKVEAEKLDATLRRARGCTEAERDDWSGRSEHMRHVFEVLQTEENYVKALHFCYLVWFRPLADGTDGAPQLTKQQLDAVFSTLFSPDEAPEASGEAVLHGDESPSAQQNLYQGLHKYADDLSSPGTPKSPYGRQTLGTGLLMRNFTLAGGMSMGSGGSGDTAGDTEEVQVKDITALQTEHMLRLLTEEDRQERPNIAKVFATRLGNRRLVSYLEMYAPFAANFQAALEAVRKLKDDVPGFSEYSDSVGHRWNSTAARSMLKSLGLKSIPVQLAQLLTLPVQRPPRYKLLLQELKKHLPADDPMTIPQLEQVVSAVDTVCHSLDEFTLQQEAGLSKVAAVSDLMGKGGSRFRQAAGIDLVVPGRAWVKGDGDDAMFYWIDPETLKPRHKPMQLLLFNDLLVVVQVSESSADHALDYLHHFDLNEGVQVCTKSKHHLLFRAMKRSGTGSGVAKPEISTMIFASEWTKGSRRARQHIGAWQTGLREVGGICDAIKRDEERRRQQQQSHMHERGEAQPHYDKLHEVQLTAFEDGLAGFMSGLRDEDAAAATIASAAAAAHHFCCG